MSKFLSIEDLAYSQQTQIDHVHIIKVSIGKGLYNNSCIAFDVPIHNVIKTIELDINNRYVLLKERSMHHLRVYYNEELQSERHYRIIENRFVLEKYPKTPMIHASTNTEGLDDDCCALDTDDEKDIE